MSFARRAFLLVAGTAMVGAALCAAGLSADDAQRHSKDTRQSPATNGEIRPIERIVEVREAAPIVGVFSADCRTCHPHEVAVWMKSAHYASDQLLFEESALDYARALGIPADRLRHDALCVRCHATVLPRPGVEPRAVYGVSCESCHGGAGGTDGWLNRHHAYGAVAGMDRHNESEQHRALRHEHCRQAGMTQADDLYEMAQRCYNCHLVDNARLVRAGHSVGSYGFEFTAWSAGEIRHNFVLDSRYNQPAPSLWMEANPGRLRNRMRLKYVLGIFVELETALKCRSQELTSEDSYYVSELADRVRGTTERLKAIDVEEARQAVTLVETLISEIEAIRAGDRAQYRQASREVSRLARAMAANHDGSGISTVDEALRELEPAGKAYHPLRAPAGH